MNTPTFSSLVLLSALSGSAHAATIDWTDWTGSSGATASGTISTGSGSISVSYTGDISFIQTGTGTNYWTEGTPAPYTGNALVDNAPTASEMIALASAGSSNTILFSESVTNPLMAIVSLGRPTLGVEYQFDAPFSVLSEGAGFWGDGSYSVLGNTLTGYEFHGVIQFNGTFDSISWSVPQGENWHGITVGVAPVPVPAAAWLFASGLLGLAGFARKKA